ncbi:MAG TPA: hypothetical protein PK297_13540 [Spirochaetota bacterium]|mgnify:FL=1|nr:hypothetical protein [Spirochaetota bacterium]
MKKFFALVLCLSVFALVACGDKTNEAAAATSAVFDKATESIGKATEALKSAKDVNAVVAALDLTYKAMDSMKKDSNAINDKYKNARGDEAKALELIKPAQERFMKAQTEFQAALQGLDTELLKDEKVQDAFKKLGELKD